MKKIALAKEKPSIDFTRARALANTLAGQQLSEPVVVAWKDDASGRFGPQIPGGAPDRWHDYGESNGGKLEVAVGDEFHFIFSEAADFEQSGLKLANLAADDGTTFLCLNEACNEEDRSKLGKADGGGKGDG